MLNVVMDNKIENLEIVDVFAEGAEFVPKKY